VIEVRARVVIRAARVNARGTIQKVIVSLFGVNKERVGIDVSRSRPSSLNA
jgi:hypothetical protein